MVAQLKPRDLSTAALGNGGITDSSQVWGPISVDVNVAGWTVAWPYPSETSRDGPCRAYGARSRRRPTQTHGGLLHFGFAVPDGSLREAGDYEIRG